MPHRARPHHHGMAKRAQPMRMQNIARAADPLAGTARGGDAPIKRLREAPDHPAAVSGCGRRQYRAK